MVGFLHSRPVVTLLVIDGHGGPQGEGIILLYWPPEDGYAGAAD